jgi:hypothetical protein
MEVQLATTFNYISFWALESRVVKWNEQINLRVLLFAPPLFLMYPLK